MTSHLNALKQKQMHHRHVTMQSILFYLRSPLGLEMSKLRKTSAFRPVESAAVQASLTTITAIEAVPLTTTLLGKRTHSGPEPTVLTQQRRHPPSHVETEHNLAEISINFQEL